MPLPCKLPRVALVKFPLDRRHLARSPLAFLLTLLAGASHAQVPAYFDTARTPAERAHDLVQRMTLEEKASQMQNHARAISRLQVPEYNWWSEALHGVVSYRAHTTVFPEPIGLAASFDDDAIHRMGDAIAAEGYIRHRQALAAGEGIFFSGMTFFSPNINIFRDPRWGRGQETYGEDPFLTARMGVAFIRGLQGDDPMHPKVGATAKHYAVHSGPEPLRHGFDAHVSAHDQEDTYLPAFRAAVTDGHVASVMCVYNAVNGIPGCANDFLLDTTLRKRWGFKGFVVSDCDAVTDISDHHHYAVDSIAARAKAVNAGMDNECKVSMADFGIAVPGGEQRPSFMDYVAAVQQGKLAEAELDRAIERTMTWRFGLGMFDAAQANPNPLSQLPDSLLDSDAHRALALDLARKSMVLLKNDGVLPLASGVSRIAVVGPLADQRTVLYGNYAGTPSRSTTVLEGIRRTFPGASVEYARGGEFPGEPTTVPTAWLTSEDGKPGLKAEYFSGSSVGGTPYLVRQELSMRPNAMTDPAPPAGPRTHSTRWTGYLTLPESGRFIVHFLGGRCSVWLDDKQVLDTEHPIADNEPGETVELEAGHRYALVVQQLPDLIPQAPTFSGLTVTHIDELQRQIRDAVAAARAADTVVAVVGITSQLEGEESPVDLPGFKGGDRTSLDLPAQEQSLLEALKATGKPLIVVLMNGSALSVNWAATHANAILEAWYPGEEGGQAVAETLAGLNNPAGRLPVTFYRDLSQLPAFEDYSMAGRTYRYFAGKPLYPFGYGLSYSSFVYDHLHVSPEPVVAGQAAAVRVRVLNSSQRAGDEVVQLYLSFPQIKGAPIRALRGFARVHLEAGESRLVSLTLSPRDLSYVDANGQRLVGGGSVVVSVGGGQPGTGAPWTSAKLSVKGTLSLPH